jgi:hypothetical protein
LLHSFNEVKDAFSLELTEESFSLGFVKLEVDKSSVYKDLEGVLDWEESFNNYNKSVRLSARAKENRVE